MSTEIPSDIQTELSDVMDRTVATMRQAVSDLRSRVQSDDNMDRLLALAGPTGWFASLFTSTSDARSAVLSSMATMDNIINRLDTSSRYEVLAGTEAPEKWLAGADPVVKGVNDIANIYTDNTTITLVAEAVAHAASDFEALVVKMADVGIAIAKPIGIGLVISVVAILGVAVYLLPKVLPIILGFTPARALRGYAPKRRVKRRRLRS